MGAGGRYMLSMRGVVRQAMAEATTAGAKGFDEALRRWVAARGQPFPAVPRRPAGAVATLGADTERVLGALSPC